MRMWMVDPKLMCHQHLLGEHREIHMLIGSIKKNISLLGYTETGLVEINAIKSRHDILVAEMFRRWSTRDLTPVTDHFSGAGLVDVEESKKELYRRCSVCRLRIWTYEPDWTSLFCGCPQNWQ